MDAAATQVNKESALCFAIIKHSGNSFLKLLPYLSYELTFLKKKNI